MVDIKDFFPSVASRVPNINCLRDKKVLVTGASGLIGNHIISTLMDVEADISVLINKTFPHVGRSFTAHSWFSLAQYKFDYIFYLAGYGQPGKFNIDPYTTIDLNSTKLMSVVKNNLKPDGSILFASTSEVYSGLTVEATEDMVGNTTPEHKRAPYIESKRCGEAIMHVANRSGINAKIARIALAYGPGVRLDDTRVMSDFIRMALDDGVIKPRGGLNAIRTYCFVSDTVQMLFNILLNGEQTVYNVGGITWMHLYDLVHIVAGVTETSVELPDNYKEDDAPDFVRMSMGRYNEEFGKMELVDFGTGLGKTMGWFEYLKGVKDGNG